MIHIKRSTDKKFYVTVIGDNGEVLSTSETLNSLQAAWKNIKAQVVSLGAVADESKGVVKFYHLKNGRKISVNKP